jgi:hypothetical protein
MRIPHSLLILTPTQTTIEHDLFAIPGNINSGTAKVTGEAVFHDQPGPPVLFGNGRQVTSNVDRSLIESSGRNGFVLAFNDNDPAAFDPICAALAG